MQTVEEQTILTVSELNATVRALLEEGLRSIVLIGEISNLVQPRSGHIYFSLKDEQAQVRCAFFRNSLRRVDFSPENGQQVLVHARATVYEPRGDFQLVVQKMELAGEGALQIAFEKLKTKLAAQGLFDEQYKKPLPRFPITIGIITSPTGAAIRDILSVLKRRSANTRVIIYPTLVQGKEAAAEIVHSIETANARNECDVLILARGGGSLEDLWPFNEAIVAHAIFASKLPIVSGIGHEIDFTIADFVADKRGATPSAAAELVSIDSIEWMQHLDNLFYRLHQLMQYKLQVLSANLLNLQHRLRDPKQQLQTFQNRLKDLKHRLILSSKQHQQYKQQQLERLAEKLDAISPLKTLNRGYAIAEHNGHILHNSKEVKVNDNVQIRLSEGRLGCQVVEVVDK